MNNYITGYVYFFHLERPLGSSKHQAQHYTGHARDLAARIQIQERGGTKAAKLLQAAKRKGICFIVHRVWLGSEEDERRLKRRKNGRRELCAICGKGVTIQGLVELTPAQIQEALIPF